MSAVDVLAIIKTKPGLRDAVLELFQANVPAVLAEDGCLSYYATIDAADGGANQTPVGPDTFVVIEKWASTGALAAHADAPHMKAYGEKTRAMLAERTIHVLRPCQDEAGV